MLEKGNISFLREYNLNLNTTDDDLIKHVLIEHLFLRFPKTIETIISYEQLKSTHFSKFKYENKINPEFYIFRWEDMEDMYQSPKVESLSLPKVIKLIAQNCKEIKIHDIKNISYSVKTNLKVFVYLKIFSSGNIEMKLKSSHSENKDIFLQHNLNLNFKDVLKLIIKDSFDVELNNCDEPTLLLKYDELKENEKRNFVRCRIENDELNPENNFELGPYGKFECACINNMKILPKTIEDAKLWSVWLIEDQLDDYADENKYLETMNKCVSKFEELYQSDEIISMLPDFNIFVEGLRDNYPYKYWHITARQFLTARR